MVEGEAFEFVAIARSYPFVGVECVDRGIQVGDIRLMMLAVVNLHRLRIDVRLERIVRVRKCRKNVGHVRGS